MILKETYECRSSAWNFRSLFSRPDRITVIFGDAKKLAEGQFSVLHLKRGKICISAVNYVFRSSGVSITEFQIRSKNIAN